MRQPPYLYASDNSAADRADRKDMAAVGRDGVFYGCFERIQHIQRHESLYSTCETAAVDAECAAAVQKDITQGKSDADSLMIDSAFHGDVLQIHIGRLTRGFHDLQEGSEIAGLEGSRFFLRALVVQHKVHGAQKCAVAADFADGSGALNELLLDEFEEEESKYRKLRKGRKKQ